MPTTSRRTTLPDTTPRTVWDWHARPGTFARLVPPWQVADIEAGPGPLEAGKQATIRLAARGLTWTWRSTITEATPPHAFVDETVGPPLARWRHVHRFEATADGTALHDDVDWALAGPARLGTRGFATDVARLLAHRHRVTVEDLAAHARHAQADRLVVGITGASGLVGRALATFLTSGGHTVVPFVRRDARPGEIGWDPLGGVLDPADLRGLDAVVHLAGEPIAGARWTADRKRRIHDSRVLGTSLLARALAQAGGPRVLVSASAVGFWGDAPDPVDESSPVGTGFLADVAAAWEAAAEPAREAGLRVVHPRLGIVVSARGGMLPVLARAVGCGVGGPIASGRQGLSWVGLDDVVGVVHEALFDPRYEGPIATVAPKPATNADVVHTLGRVLGRPTLARAPAAAVRLALGQLGDEMLVAGQCVVPARLRALGYCWRRPELEDAVRWELGRFDP